MATFYKSTFTNIKVIIDGNSYKNCVFENCILEFGGNGSVSLVGNHISGCQWVFTGAAGTTIAFLKGLYHGGSGGQELINHLLADTTMSSVQTPLESPTQPSIVPYINKTEESKTHGRPK